MNGLRRNIEPVSFWDDVLGRLKLIVGISLGMVFLALIMAFAVILTFTPLVRVVRVNGKLDWDM